MTEVLEDRDVTPPGKDGWVHRYRIRRNDGEEVMVIVDCSGSAEASAGAHEDIARLVNDRGRALALEKADRAASGRGATVHIKARGHFGVSHEYSYEDKAGS